MYYLSVNPLNTVYCRMSFGSDLEANSNKLSDLMFFFKLQNCNWSLIVISEVGGPKEALVIRLHSAGSGTSSCHVMTAVPSKGHIMIMFPLVCCYDCFGVCCSSFNMLPDIASVISAFVIAPAHWDEIYQVLHGICYKIHLTKDVRLKVNKNFRQIPQH